MSSSNTVRVFLGGSCNPTTWRKDTAIPLLEKYGITYYNPQVEEWHEGLIEEENKAKNGAQVLLFAIDDMTRGVMSIAEAAFYIGQQRKVVLVIQDYPVDAANPAEGKDMNRGRAYLRTLAKEFEVPVFDDVASAIERIKLDMDMQPSH